MITLRAGRASAEIDPQAGGRLGQLDFGDGPLLRGPADGLRWTDWGCYPLAPWSNRIPSGRLVSGEVDAQLPVNHHDGSAIHGLVAERPWEVTSNSGQRAELQIRVREEPFEIAARQVFDLSDTTLVLTLAVTNLAERTLPMGIGIHPWFRAGPVTVSADHVWPGEPLPVAQPRRVAGRWDLRTPTRPAPMDACFTGLAGCAATAPGVQLSWQGPVTHVVVYSGEPGWVCIEPVTMANNAIALAELGVAGHGLQQVAPGGSLEVRYTFEPLGCA